MAAALRRLGAFIVILAALLAAGSALSALPALAATSTQTIAATSTQAIAAMSAKTMATADSKATAISVGQRILDRAETRTGDWYVYGAAGPSYFDCSGLVAWSATSIGLKNWPRDTYDIAAEIGTRFTITYHPRRGDLALWGPVSAPYHVEIVTKWRATTFGAQHTGTRVGWHDDAWSAPSFYLHVNW
jgi:cell wall-associated NlpC family hydrolase